MLSVKFGNASTMYGGGVECLKSRCSKITPCESGSEAGAPQEEEVLFLKKNKIIFLLVQLYSGYVSYKAPMIRKPVLWCPPWKSTQLLKKARPKRFITKKVRAICNRAPEIFEIEKSSKISSKIFIENCMKMKIFEIKKNRKMLGSFFFNWISNEHFDDQCRDFSISKFWSADFKML